MLTQERLKKLFKYDPETGEFIRLVRVCKRVHVGDIAGSYHKDGYLHFHVDKKLYLSHRLDWLYVYGYFPEHQVDHKNGVRDDNRLCNLRVVSQSCNLQNQRIHSNNSSGFPGVCWHKKHKKWYAQSQIQGKQKFMGLYATALDAALARLTAEISCPLWTCNHRGELVKAIKKAWPEFNERCLN